MLTIVYFLLSFTSPVYAAPADSVYKLYLLDQDTGTRLGHGTGFLIEVDGVKAFMTNAHICATGRLQVAGKGWELKPTLINAQDDLCIAEPTVKELKIKNKPLPISDQIPTDGEVVRVIGYPLDKPKTTVSGRLNLYTFVFMLKTVPVEELDNAFQGLCINSIDQIDGGATCWDRRESYGVLAQIQVGNSGSPVINREGKVIGVIWGTKIPDGPGLAVKIEKIKRMIDIFKERR